MRCRTCDYPLWNIPTRQCPECGTSFVPSDFEFVPNAVQYCCPKCEQVYYGTDYMGHLVPKAFACVQCGEALHMDRMVCRPAGEIAEEDTRKDQAPWEVRRQRGVVKSWFRTIGASMAQPQRLMRGVSVERGTGSAWLFLFINTMLVGVLGIGVIAMCIGVANYSGMMDVMAGLFGWIVILAGVMLIVAIWGLVTHGLLRLTGGAGYPLSRTYQAICYSSGPLVIAAVPCLGPYMLIYVAAVWWTVSAVLMVAEGQQVGGGRASLATIAFPALGVVLGIGGFMAFMIVVMNQIAAMPTMMGGGWGNTMSVTSAMQMYALDNNGKVPDHASELLVANQMWAPDFVTIDTSTGHADVPIGDQNLDAFIMLSDLEKLDVVQDAVDAQPANVVAHRLGDFVFTYHGMNLNTTNGQLWIVITWPDPDVNTSGAPVIVEVGKADGTVESIDGTLFDARLDDQNALRALNGLAPIPHPEEVTHDTPAVSPDAP